MSTSIPVFQYETQVGVFDPAKATLLGEAGTEAWEIEHAGCGQWTGLWRLPNDWFALVDRSWDEVAGERLGQGTLIDRKEAVAWLLQHKLPPPDDMLADAGLEDFTKGVPEPDPQKQEAAMKSLFQLLYPQQENGDVSAGTDRAAQSAQPVQPTGNTSNAERDAGKETVTHKAGRRERDRKTEARDKWLYQQCCKRTPYKQIAQELLRIAQQKQWEPIESPQGIHQAAKRYAERHKLQPPPSRKDGR